MKAVVTGGAGFIGSHLTDRLLEEGFEVAVVDNIETGNKRNLAKAIANPACTLFECDIAHPLPQEIFDGATWVFHLAGLADIVPSIEAPIRYHEVNANGTVNVLEAARAANVQRFVYAASSSCYGIPDQYPTPVASPIRTMYPYAHTKYVGETYVHHWSKTYSLPSVSLRLFNVYGPRSRTNGAYGAVFGVFLAQKLANRPYTVVGDGNQTRDFVYVSDVVEAFIAAARSDESGKSYNVGTGTPQSVNRLVELLGGEKSYIPKRPGEPDITHADISLTVKELAWKPTVAFEDGVAEMLRNIDMWRDAPVWTENSIADATKTWFECLG